MATTKAKAAKTKASTPMEYVQDALGDVDKARQSAQGEAKAQLERASERLRDLAVDMRERAGDEMRELESTLDRAGETLRLEIALRAIRAQSSTESLTKISAEIRKRKAELAA